MFKSQSVLPSHIKMKP